MHPFLAPPETAAAKARNDLIAWTAGGVFAAFLISLGTGGPLVLVPAALFALMTRRAVASFVSFG